MDLKLSINSVLIMHLPSREKYAVPVETWLVLPVNVPPVIFVPLSLAGVK